MTDQASQAEFGQKLSDASRELADVVIRAFQTSGAVHPATVIAGCARMAGTLMFRTFPPPPAGVHPGDAVLTRGADEQGAMLMRVTANILGNLNVALPASPPPADGTRQAEPMHEFLSTQRVLEPLFAPVLARFDFTPVQDAQAAAVATALLIHHFLAHLDAGVAFRIATLGIVEGCKTAPDPVTMVRPLAGA